MQGIQPTRVVISQQYHHSTPHSTTWFMNAWQTPCYWPAEMHGFVIPLLLNLPDGRLGYRLNHRVGIAIIKQVAPVEYSEIA